MRPGDNWVFLVLKKSSQKEQVYSAETIGRSYGYKYKKKIPGKPREI